MQSLPRCTCGPTFLQCPQLQRYLLPDISFHCILFCYIQSIEQVLIDMQPKYSAWKEVTEIIGEGM